MDSEENIILGVKIFATIFALGIFLALFGLFYVQQRNDFSSWIHSESVVVNTHRMHQQANFIPSTKSLCPNQEIIQNLQVLGLENAISGTQKYKLKYQNISKYLWEYNRMYQKSQLFGLPFPTISPKNVETTVCFELQKID